ncbi:MAG TPA: type II and III secretion system protein family protein [Sphingomonas sp.]
MTKHPLIRHSVAGTALAAALALAVTVAPATPVAAKWHPRGPARPAARPATAAPSAGNLITLSISRGQLITLPRPMSDLFVADDKVADVQVRSPRQLYVFGKGMGETTVSATAKDGTVVYAATVRVGNNITSLSQMLKIAMPEAQITASPMNGMVLLTGTVASPDDIEEASRLVGAFVGQGYQVVNRVKTATPLQVMLRVRFSEVNRDIAQTIGNNILTRGNTSGAPTISQGNAGSITTNASQTIDPGSGAGYGQTIYSIASAATGAGSRFGFAGHFLGMDVISALDLAETDGYATTLAQPTLTALSGETASFLAGGEIPIPVPQYQGVTTIEYKQYGVSLSFTPTVLADGRISMRVRPEVSQLSSSSVVINGYSVPSLTTRRTETTVELGSGESFVIGGLLSNNTSNSITKAPFLGDLPILGQLFRSNSFKKSESELVIVVTPYLVRPASESQISLPTDGYRAPTDLQRVLMNRGTAGKSGKKHDAPQQAAPVTDTSGGAPVAALPADTRRKDGSADAAPGISYN